MRNRGNVIGYVGGVHDPILQAVAYAFEFAN